MIFKIHYGLWYGAMVGIIPFMFNYAVIYTGATGAKYGTLFSVLPFIVLFAKPLVGSCTDCMGIHKFSLLLFIFITMISYGALAFFPFIILHVPAHMDDVKQTYWQIFCILASVGYTSMCVVNSLGDTLATNSSARNNVDYSEYRMWGPVGFGIFGAIWGFTNANSPLPPYTPGIITLVLLLIIDSIILLAWPNKKEFELQSREEQSNSANGSLSSSVNYGSTTNAENQAARRDSELDTSATRSTKSGQLALLWRLFCENREIGAYLFIFTFCGIMTGIHWQFFFGYLDKIAKKNFSTVAALALPVQALLGELPSFKLSKYILGKLGSFMTLVICLFSFAARYLSYAYIITENVNVYWILVVELLQGPAFGLMYCVLTSKSYYYSKKVDEMLESTLSPGDIRLRSSLHATLQGLIGAAFEGLGIGLGAILGGLAYDIDVFYMWKLAGFSALVVAVSCLLVGLGSYIKRPPSEQNIVVANP